MPEDDRLMETTQIIPGTPVYELLADAIHPGLPQVNTAATGLTADQIRQAIDSMKRQVMEPYRLPPIHPRAYERALELLRLPKGHQLTETEYWRAAVIEKWTAEIDLPEGVVLDPNSDQPGISINGYAFVILPDGTRTAWPLPRSEYDLLCPVCRAGDGQDDCTECSGRGKVDHIPYADRPWDEVVPGLWLGGHACQPKGAPPEGNCYLSDSRGPESPDWDVVVSLHHEHNDLYEPDHAVFHLRHRMRDADLDPEHHTRLDEFATHVSGAVGAGYTVLVRCAVGLNRGALVTGLAMLKMGWSAADAIDRMREVRSPYVLGNASFVNYLHEVESKGSIKEA